jgi:hypothetical protein
MGRRRASARGPRREPRAVRLNRCALAALVLLGAELGGDETGLSRGPADPSDLGTRCAAIAGREDRAYLKCAEPERAGPQPSDVIRLERPYTDHPAGDGRPRRYPQEPR